MPRTEVFNREEVIVKAQNVFWTKGYNGTSMQDLADATGLNRSSIYNSFGNKMELYKNCLSHYQGSNFEYITQLFNNADSPLTGIRSFLTNMVLQITADRNGKGCMVVKCSTEMANQDNLVADWLVNNQKKMTNIFKEALIKAQQSDELSNKKDPETLANYLVSFTQGLRVNGNQNKNAKVLHAMVAHAMDTLA